MSKRACIVIIHPDFLLPAVLHHARSVPIATAALLAVLAIPSCTVREEPDATLARADSILLASSERAAATGLAAGSFDTVALGEGRRSRRLSALADSIAQRLVFMTYGQRAQLVSAREGRLLMDLGRVDRPLTTPAEREAYDEAMRAVAPVRSGETFRLHASWGPDVVEVSGFDVSAGRMVAVLRGSVVADSAVADPQPVVAVATRSSPVDSVVAHARCERGGRAPGDARLRAITDSLLGVARRDTSRLNAHQRRAVRTVSSRTSGCFAGATRLVIAALVAGDHDHVRQLAVLVDSVGGVIPLTITDPRFRVHEALHALDADGDGVDDVAVRGRARRVAGTVVLRLDPNAQQLTPMATGFAWEAP